MNKPPDGAGASRSNTEGSPLESGTPAPAPPVSRCKGCGRKVYFLKDEKGTTQILDAVAPCYQIEQYNLTGATPQTVEMEVKVTRNRLAFVSHYATCPKASQF